MYDYSDVMVDEPLRPSPVCQILYTDEFKELISIAKGLMQKDEHSERALALTERVIKKVAAHYTIWSYRFNIVQDLEGFDLQKELDWCAQIALNNPKNYQIWHYRSLIIELILKRKGTIPLENEYSILKQMLDQDSKNYHVWSYRRWLVEKFDLFRTDSELSYTEEMLAADVRNNSAWNHRFYVLLGNKKGLPDNLLNKELEFVQDKIRLAPTNPSSWNYIKGIYFKLGMDISNLEPLATTYTDLKAIYSLFAFELLAEISVKQHKSEKAVELYTLLQDMDGIRKRYWQWKIDQLA
ncbi:hypothetical protein OGAPHI_005665 [Ogataea philodendri]|uniref:Protein farnesyltransferase/geranylgeranyltransferase type-1 subunit alpha n=1 Tax=Ogataea philodendri TaxID=1378263 RepID=A0A9P8NYU0_9ASCO|nr:uncharacterized protein OGAPHI_005665 [Ogataea philodendri]KAH3662413.1 hypothetical protein OGAPHI_005665 [Ogataea philodendri]